MNGIELLRQGEVRVRAEFLRQNFQRVAAGLPTGAFKRLVESYEGFARWTIKYYDAAVQVPTTEPDPAEYLKYVDSLFSGTLSTVQKECAGLVHPPGIEDFPEELAFWSKTWICEFGGYDSKKTSVVLLPQWQYHSEFRAFPNPVSRITSELENPIGLNHFDELDKELVNQPETFLVFKFPRIDARNVLYHPVLLHEFGHAIDRKNNLWAKVYSKLKLGQIDKPKADSVVAWIREFLADLFAIHLGGPCFLLPFQQSSVIANVLDSDSEIHPASRTRLAVMLEYLQGTLGYPTNDPESSIEKTIASWGVVASFEDELKKATGFELNRTHLLTDEVRLQLGTVVGEFCKTAGLPRFDREQFAGRARHLVDERLRRGLPSVPCPSINGVKWSPLPDVFNAVWELWLGKRSFFDDFEEIPENARGAALRSLSNLAFKGIQVAEHQHLWREVSTEDLASELSTAHPPHKIRTKAVLTALSIRESLKNERLVITPLLEDKQVGDASVNLRLGTHFVITRAADLASFKPDEFGAGEIRQCQEHVTRMLGEVFVLHPRRLVLATTLEYIAVPEDLAALVLSRSSFGRLGLIVATAAFVHPGWKGCLTLELSNAADIPIELPCGSPIAQLVLFRADELSRAPTDFPVDRQPYPTFPEFSPLSSEPDWKKLKAIGKRLKQL